MTAVALPFVSVIVITLVSFVPIDAGLKAFVAVSAVSAAFTFSVALAGVVLAPVLVEVTAPAASVLV